MHKRRVCCGMESDFECDLDNVFTASPSIPWTEPFLFFFLAFLLFSRSPHTLYRLTAAGIHQANDTVRL